MAALIFGICAAVSLLSWWVCHNTKQQPVETFILIFLEWIFAFCLELRFIKSASDDILGECAPRLRRNPDLIQEIKRLVSQALNARSLKSHLINKHLDRIIEHARNDISDLANGTLSVDLGSGGRHLPDLVELCDHKYQGVSLVNLEEYWHGSAGVESLEKTKKARENGRIVERIFIEHRSQFPTLANFIREHAAAGVSCFVVEFERIDSGLRKDFAIIDGDKAAVELTVADRTCTEAHYWFNTEGSAGCIKLNQLVDTWQRLKNNAKSAEDFLRSYPVAPALASPPIGSATPISANQP